MSAESWAEQEFGAALTTTNLWLKLRNLGVDLKLIKVVPESQPIGEVMHAARKGAVVAVVGYEGDDKITLIRIKRL